MTNSKNWENSKYYGKTKEQIKNALNGSKPEAIIIRTIPNSDTKKSKKYSNTNWAYLIFQN